MKYQEIFNLIAKGLSVAEALVEAGQAALPAIKAVQTVVEGAQEGEVTDDQLMQTSATLDEMINEFNLELPE